MPQPVVLEGLNLPDQKEVEELERFLKERLEKIRKLNDSCEVAV